MSQENKKPKRYETSMIPVRVGQDQTYPSLMKVCKQLSSRWSCREWSNSSNTERTPPTHWESITASTLHFSINLRLICEERLHAQFFNKICCGTAEMTQVLQASRNISRNRDTHALQCWLVNFHHSQFVSTEQQFWELVKPKPLLPSEVEREQSLFKQKETWQN